MARKLRRVVIERIRDQLYCVIRRTFKFSATKRAYIFCVRIIRTTPLRLLDVVTAIIAMVKSFHSFSPFVLCVFLRKSYPVFGGNKRGHFSQLCLRIRHLDNNRAFLTNTGIICCIYTFRYQTLILTNARIITFPK